MRSRPRPLLRPCPSSTRLPPEPPPPPAKPPRLASRRGRRALAAAIAGVLFVGAGYVAGQAADDDPSQSAAPRTPTTLEPTATGATVSGTAEEPVAAVAAAVAPVGRADGDLRRARVRRRLRRRRPDPHRRPRRERRGHRHRAAGRRHDARRRGARQPTTAPTSRSCRSTSEDALPAATLATGVDVAGRPAGGRHREPVRARPDRDVRHRDAPSTGPCRRSTAPSA